MKNIKIIDNNLKVQSEESDLIKIHLPSPHKGCFNGETVWAIPKGEGVAEINNIPFFADVGFRDLVIYTNINGINEYIETIEAKTISIAIEWKPTYSSDKEETTKEWQKIYEYIKNKDLACESACPGYFVIAFPVGITEQGILDITSKCPIKLTPFKI